MFDFLHFAACSIGLIFLGVWLFACVESRVHGDIHMWFLDFWRRYRLNPNDWILLDENVIYTTRLRTQYKIWFWPIGVLCYIIMRKYVYFRNKKQQEAELTASFHKILEARDMEEKEKCSH